MLNLIRNEWMKSFNRIGTYTMIGILVLFVLGIGGIEKYMDVKHPPKENPNWKTELQQQNIQYQTDLKGNNSDSYKEYLKGEVAKNNYRIEHDIAPNEKMLVWKFVESSSGLIQLVGMFVIVIAAGIVASEFSWGTIKLLLIRPMSRSKILLSKYLAVLLFAGFFLLILFGLSTLVGWVLFGTEDTTYLTYSAGKVTEMPILLYLGKVYLYASINMLMLSTMAFMISAVFRNSSLAIGISLTLMFVGSTITNILAMQFDFEWTKYILFANTNLMMYENGQVLVEGMTKGFSITVLLAYFIVFMFFSFFIFKKRDVTA